MKFYNKKQLDIWRKQHEDVPANMLEDVVSLRSILEDMESSNAMIERRIGNFYVRYGKNLVTETIVKQVIEAADRTT
jgi:hypothetical protein